MASSHFFASMAALAALSAALVDMVENTKGQVVGEAQYAQQDYCSAMDAERRVGVGDAGAMHDVPRARQSLVQPYEPQNNTSTPH